MDYFLQMGEVLPYHKDPTIVEAGNILLILFSIVITVWVNKVLRSIPKGENALDPKNGNRVVSPFLIAENRRGEFGVSKGKIHFFHKAVAIVMILIFAAIPLAMLLEDSGWTYVLYY